MSPMSLILSPRHLVQPKGEFSYHPKYHFLDRSLHAWPHHVTAVAEWRGLQYYFLAPPWTQVRRKGPLSSSEFPSFPSSLTVLQYIRNPAVFLTHRRIGSDHILLVTGDAPVSTPVPERKAVVRQRE